MTIFFTIKTALNSLSLNKTRTVLTVLGIIVGISSVIVVYSAGAGLNNIILSQIESFGSNIVETEIKIPSAKSGVASESQNAASMASGVQITSLTLDDMSAINKLPNISRSYGTLMGQELASYANEIKKSIIWGTSNDFINIDKSEIEIGRFFSKSEDKSLAKLVVLGSEIKTVLFAENNPLGKAIKIGKSKYRVIGVLKERGEMMGLDFDNNLYIPIRTMQKRLLGVKHLGFMVHELENTEMADETANLIRDLLRVRHDIPSANNTYVSWLKTGSAKDDFRVTTMKEMMDTMSVVTDAITFLLLAIVAISLIVGGVGILNIMYVSVGERTGEIGLRKALGANYRDIMWQFLSESIIITLLGGFIGVLIGICVSFLISFFANKSGIEWGFSIPFRAYFVALSFSLFFGLAFGLYPARKAARLEPITALNKE